MESNQYGSTIAIEQKLAQFSSQILSNSADPREQLVLDNASPASITEDIASIVEQPMPRWWLPAFAFSLSLATVSVVMIVYLIATGVGVWGLNQPVGWAWDITNFVFWVGIGHAGTLISAILFLLKQNWRTSINRAAEAMTIFAVICAGIFPAIHVGRLWRVYFLAPVPNHLAIWPNFRSPLFWDVVAVSTYATVSAMFWYVGLIPDLAMLRDRAKTKTKAILYGFFALGWRGSQQQWRHYEMAYLLLAGLSTPLVISVHTIVSFDFATSQIAGWHTTIFPPYFVAGAVFSGFAMVLTIMIPLRWLFSLEHLITKKHLDLIAKVLLGTGCLVGYAYVTELFMAYYSGNPYESFVFFKSRMNGPFAWAYWIMFSCNVFAPQLFWFKKVRDSIPAMFAISLLVNVGMWFERFVIIVTSLSRDALPSAWGSFSPSWVEILTFVGSFGVFITCFLLFIRYLPLVNAAEVKSILSHDAMINQSGPTQDTVNNSEVDPTIDTSALSQDSQLAGYLAEFKDPHSLMNAAAALRAENYTELDAYTPFPVHGMDEALGMRRSSLGWYTLIGGVSGAVFAAALQYYGNAVWYPTITAGKPLASWPAFLPVIFEFSVLFAAFATVFGMFKLTQLPRWNHRLFDFDEFSKATNNGYFLHLSGNDPQLSNDNSQLATIFFQHQALSVKAYSEKA